jgi:hypothetical protein
VLGTASLDREFARRLLDEIAARMPGLTSGTPWPFYIDDQTGLVHTPGYTLCRGNGHFLACSPVAAKLVEALNEALRQETGELKWYALLDMAASLCDDDPVLQKEIACLKRPPKSGRATRHKPLNRLFIRNGLWQTLVWPGTRKGSYRLELEQSYD